MQTNAGNNIGNSI